MSGGKSTKQNGQKESKWGAKQTALERAKKLDAYPKLTSFFTGGAAAARASPGESTNVTGDDEDDHGEMEQDPQPPAAAVAAEDVVVAGPSGAQDTDQLATTVTAVDETVARY